jgi:hypothetical protein
MKTAVIGLFDDEEDTRRVLAQLVGSPLDLSTIQVVAADSQVERRLSADAGLPGKHHVMAGVIAGAVLGTALGVIAGLELALLERLGTVLSGSAGLLLGGIVGGVIGAVVGRLSLPEGQDEILMEALDDGAIAIVVRTENVPTARAIRDLFQSGGSRVEPLEPHAGGGAPEPGPAGTPESGAAAPGKEDHSQFAPPSASPEASGDR